MASGDIVGATNSSVLAGASLIIQPPAGESWMLVLLTSSDPTATGALQLYDGVNVQTIVTGDRVPKGAPSIGLFVGARASGLAVAADVDMLTAVPLSNTQYARYNNTNAGAVTVSWRAVKIK